MFPSFTLLLFYLGIFVAYSSDHPLPSCFILVSTQRSGTGWMIDSLNRHSEILTSREVLRQVNYTQIDPSVPLSEIPYFPDIYPPTVLTRYREYLSSMTKQGTWKKMERVLEKSFAILNERSRSEQPSARVIGFKVMYNQGVLKYRKEFIQYCERHNISLIHLIRRNILRRIISEQIRQYSQGSVGNYAHPLTPYELHSIQSLKIALPSDRIVKMIQKEERVIELMSSELVSAQNSNQLTIYYEDLVHFPSLEFNKIHHFLHVTPSKLISLSLKIHSKPMSEYVTNMKDISDALRGTKYEEMIEDVI